MATIKDVAEHAKVSVATVSRVLNNSGTVSPDTTRKVMLAVRDLNYAPNPAARNLRKNESRSILIFIPKLTNPYYYSILDGISNASHSLDYSAFILSLEHNPQQEDIILHSIQNKRADGIIFLFCDQDDLWLNKYVGEFPMVFCSEYIESINAPFIGIDNFKAAYDAVAHLVSLGHRKIGMITSQNDYISTRLRYKGYCQVFNDYELSFRRDYIAYGSKDYSFDSGVEAAKQLLTLPDPPTAVFCVSDRLALGAISAAKQLGISVPDDFSVWGFDNIEYANMFSPRLSTVAQPCYEIGYTAVETLDRLINSPDKVPEKNRDTNSSSVNPLSRILDYRLILRESIAAPKGSGVSRRK